MRKRAITGWGVVSPLGVGHEAFTAAFADVDAARRAAFRGPTELLAEVAPGALLAEVWDWDPKHWLGPKGHRTFDRLTKFLIVAAGQALSHAGIKQNREFIALAPDRVGICSATAYGSLDAITELNRVAELEDPRYINPTRFPNTVINAAAGYVSIWEDLRALNTTIVDGNCGALDAVLTADLHLCRGRADAFLVGGGEVLTEPLFLAMLKLGIVAESDAAPGLHLGEGAAYLVVESLEGAEARSAHVYAEILGFGTSFDPPDSEALLVHASARAVEEALRLALVDAQLDASAIDVVCAARSGFGAFDDAEETALAGIFDDSTACVEPKRVFGETFGASGAMNLAAAMAFFDGAPVAPLFRGSAPSRVDHALALTVGFYGNVSAVVLGRRG
jgi:3-oxoacyl-(acyl-carrier-protein) synthase